MRYMFFPEEEQELQRELIHHPALMDKLQKYPQNEKELILAEIATHCEIILDGYYTGEMLTKLCGIMAKRLKEKRPPPVRSGIVIINSLGVEDIAFQEKS